jgi:hypothetical protein
MIEHPNSKIDLSIVVVDRFGERKCQIPVAKNLRNGGGNIVWVRETEGAKRNPEMRD